MKTITLLITLVAALFAFPVAAASNGANNESSGILIKALGSDEHFYGLLGFAKFDNYDKNMGYFAYERFGLVDEFDGKENNTFKVSRFSLKGDAYASPDTPAKMGFSGAKVDLYYSTTTAADGYEWKNFGVGLGMVATPIPGLTNFHVTPGVQYESKYLSFDWSKDQEAQYDYYVDAEYYLGKRFAIVGQYNRFMAGQLFEGDKIQEILVFGFRLFI